MITLEAEGLEWADLSKRPEDKADPRDYEAGDQKPTKADMADPFWESYCL